MGNAGLPYYVELSEWCRVNGSDVTYAVSSGMLQFVDPKQRLKRKVIAIMFVAP